MPEIKTYKHNEIQNDKKKR